MAQRVFVVEDDLFLESVICRILRTAAPGIEIDWTTNGDEAVRRLQGIQQGLRRPYDLILADIYLDGNATGIDLWNACRESCPETPVLLTSSLTYEGFFKIIGRDRIAPPYLAKPFSPGEFAQMIKAFLR